MSKKDQMKCRWMPEDISISNVISFRIWTLHIHNGVLLSYKKERIWVSSNEVDETGAYYTAWSKPERKPSIQYTNVYIWNLERW